MLGRGTLQVVTNFVAVVLLLIAGWLWVRPLAADVTQFRHVRLWEGTAVATMHLRTSARDSFDLLQGREGILWVYGFLTDCPACKRLKAPMLTELTKLGVANAFAISVEPDSLIREYWNQTRAFGVGQMRGDLPRFLAQVPVLICISGGRAQSVFLGDVASALRKYGRESVQRSRCPS